MTLKGPAAEMEAEAAAKHIKRLGLILGRRGISGRVGLSPESQANLWQFPRGRKFGWQVVRPGRPAAPRGSVLLGVPGFRLRSVYVVHKPLPRSASLGHLHLAVVHDYHWKALDVVLPGYRRLQVDPRDPGPVDVHPADRIPLRIGLAGLDQEHRKLHARGAVVAREIDHRDLAGAGQAVDVDGLAVGELLVVGPASPA